jgi:hypothetical protein
MAVPVLVSPPHEHNDKCCGGTRYDVVTNETISNWNETLNFSRWNNTVQLLITPGVVDNGTYTHVPTGYLPKPSELRDTTTDWANLFHNAAHYDDAHQICCNTQEGYPSTRDKS